MMIMPMKEMRLVIKLARIINRNVDIVFLYLFYHNDHHADLLGERNLIISLKKILTRINIVFTYRIYYAIIVYVNRWVIRSNIRSFYQYSRWCDGLTIYRYQFTKLYTTYSSNWSRYNRTKRSNNYKNNSYL